MCWNCVEEPEESDELRSYPLRTARPHRPERLIGLVNDLLGCFPGSMAGADGSAAEAR
jgi:hypothetical protein